MAATTLAIIGADRARLMDDNVSNFELHCTIKFLKEIISKTFFISTEAIGGCPSQG
jgi:hypothetical protein